MEDTREALVISKKDNKAVSTIKRYCVHRNTFGPNIGKLCGKTALHNGTAYLLPHERLSPTYQAWFCKKHFLQIQNTMDKRQDIYNKATKLVKKGKDALQEREERKVTRIVVPVTMVNMQESMDQSKCEEQFEPIYDEWDEETIMQLINATSEHT
jgi:hypothetical protein